MAARSQGHCQIAQRRLHSAKRALQWRYRSVIGLCRVPWVNIVDKRQSHGTLPAIAFLPTKRSSKSPAFRRASDLHQRWMILPNRTRCRKQRGYDWTQRFPLIAGAVAPFHAHGGGRRPGGLLRQRSSSTSCTAADHAPRRDGAGWRCLSTTAVGKRICLSYDTSGPAMENRPPC